jgi:intracellular sulfur oxidation DsrE/DsrF family protein
MERGHPLTIFLNDRGIYLASKTHGAKYVDQQKLLSELLSKGTVVIACPQCLKQFDISEGDLLPGVQVGSPSLTGGALFKNGTQTLSW